MNIIDILAPDLPESVLDGTVISINKKLGESINRDDVFAEIETDKIILEVRSPESGVVDSLLVKKGEVIYSKQILGRINIVCKKNKLKVIDNNFISKVNHINLSNEKEKSFSPSKRREFLKKKKDIDIKNDNLLHKNNILFTNTVIKSNKNIRNKNRIPMSNLRKCISLRLLESKNNTAMLTTFNEVNMKYVIDIRKKYNFLFEKKNKVKLGFMSFYIKAVLEALKHFPIINACIDGDDIVYYNYFDINIAISTSRGLITPILKDVDKINMSEIEKKIKDLVIKGENNQLTVDDLSNGNFTITNGGVFGSLLSTPILNPPQSAILGIHAIKNRPVVVNNKIVVLPMVYLALTYDHRLIDGKESVGFLLKIKEILEDPIRLLLNI